MESYERLEARWADRLDVDPEACVVCSSGTAALWLALQALGIPSRSQVIVPEFTNIACARAVSMADLKPVFCDVREDLLIDFGKLYRSLTSLTRAVMPVHVYGRQCDMERLSRLSQDWGLKVIEDCSEFHGGPISPNSDAACWSFYKNKVVAGEEGGVVFFRDLLVADSARRLRNLGHETHFLHSPYGFNLRLSNANADLIHSSLDHYEENLSLRKEIEAEYDRRIPLDYRRPERVVPWVYDVRVRGWDIEHVVDLLNQAGIEARAGFKPMSQQEEYRGHYESTVAYWMSQDILYFPIRPEMTKDEVQKIAETFLSIVEP